MIKKNLSIKTAFIVKNEYISKEDFLKGLKSIGLTNFSAEDLELLVESLQYEDSGEPYISLEEIEELFEFYGVPR